MVGDTLLCGPDVVYNQSVLQNCHIGDPKGSGERWVAFIGGYRVDPDTFLGVSLLGPGTSVFGVDGVGGLGGGGGWLSAFFDVVAGVIVFEHEVWATSAKDDPTHFFNGARACASVCFLTNMHVKVCVHPPNDTDVDITRPGEEKPRELKMVKKEKTDGERTAILFFNESK